MACDAFGISLKNRNHPGYTAVYIEEGGETFHPKDLSEKSFTATVVNSGTSIIRNVTTPTLSEDTVTINGISAVRSMIGTPLKIGDKTIGMLTAQSYQLNSYSNNDRILLEMIAAQGAIALENSRLFAETQQRAEEFSELYEITQDLTTHQNINLLLSLIIQRAAKLLGSRYGSIYIYDETQDQLELAIITGYDPDKGPPSGLRLKRGDGMAWKVFESKQPLIINNYLNWEGRSDEYGKFPFSSVLEVPMLYAGDIIGVLAINEIAPETRQFTDADVRLLSLFAAQAAGAIHSARLFEQTRNRVVELETIHRVSSALRTAQTPDEMFSIVLDETLISLNAPAGTIWLHNSNTQELYQKHARGWIGQLKPSHHKTNEGIIGHIFTSNEAYISQDISLDERVLEYSRPRIQGKWSAALVPIRTTNATLGVLAIVAPETRQFTQNDTNILTILAEIAGNAIHRATLHEHAKQQLRRLTALRNIDAAISSSLNLNLTLNILIDHTISQLEIDAADVLLYNAPMQTLTYAAGKGFHTGAFLKTTLRLGEGFPGRAALERKMISAPSLDNLPNCARQAAFSSERFLSYFCVPLSAKGQIVGVLEIFNRTQISPSPE